MIKLFATDIDHTMYCNEIGEIPQANYQAIEELLKQGVVVCLASSRMYSGVEKEIEKMHLEQYQGYVTVNNGAYTVRLKDRKVLTNQAFSLEQLHQIKQIADQYHLGFAITQNQYNITTSYAKIFDYNHKAVGCDIVITDDVFRYVCEPVYQLTLFHDDLDMYQVCQQLIQEYGDLYNFNVPQTACCDVSIKGVNKYLGVKAIADDLGISMEEVACIGDNDNDVPMLEKAKISACVANGSVLAKQAAKVVVKSDQEAGVAQFIYDYVLK